MIKQLPKPIKLKRFTIMATLWTELTKNDYFVICNKRLCMNYYYGNIDFKKCGSYFSKKMKDAKFMLKYFIINNNYIRKISSSINIKKENDYYELYFEGDQYCGDLIIPKRYKQKPKDFLKEFLYSEYGESIK